MIRSSKHSLKDCNKAKLLTLQSFSSTYHTMLQKYVFPLLLAQGG